MFPSFDCERSDYSWRKMGCLEWGDMNPTCKVRAQHGALQAQTAALIQLRSPWTPAKEVLRSPSENKEQTVSDPCGYLGVKAVSRAVIIFLLVAVHSLPYQEALTHALVNAHLHNTRHCESTDKIRNASGLAVDLSLTYIWWKSLSVTKS